MGTARWAPSDWKTYSSKTKSTPADRIFTSTSISNDLDPKGVYRESRDSPANPESTAVIVGCDVTGSMGMIADNLIKEGIGVLFDEILERKPVSDPHLMVMGIGDATCDSAPLQVSQFEADLTIAKQLEQVYVEKGGGGNHFESYDLPAYFAAYHTSIDCFEKRNKKGYLFTIGDELPPGITTQESVNSIMGDSAQADIPFSEVIEAAERTYNVYHIIVAEGHYARSHGVENVRKKWADTLGQNAVVLTDYTKLAEVIVSIIEVNEGRDKTEVAASWGGDTSLVVGSAVSDLTVGGDFDGASDALQTF